MKKRVLVPMGNGTEEMEAVIIIDILRRAGIDVVIAAEYNKITCSRGVNIVPDKKLEDVVDEQFDAIILPGGLEGTMNLAKNKKVSKLLNQHNANKKLIGAICAAPLALQSNNLIKNCTLTSHPSIKTQLVDVTYLDKKVVIDGNIITSRGAGTAIDFSLEIVRLLINEDTANEIKQAIVLN